MKQANIFLILILFSLFVYAQKNTSTSIERRIRNIEDRMAIKALVDVFSNLADTKEIDKQVQLFTEDGVVQSYSDGKLLSDIKGRAQLQKVFSGFLSQFKTVYHQNGQQTIDDLQENTARATSYCRVILVGEQNGKQVKTTMYAIYKDDFVKQKGRWFFKKRISDFVHRETGEIK